MSNICLINLVGIPAAGKTTFCQNILNMVHSKRLEYNIVCLSYDDFIRIPDNNEEYLKSGQYRKNRCCMGWVIQNIIEGIQRKQGFINVSMILRQEFPENTFDATKSLAIHQCNINKYVILIDDNMYYKSMRKQIRSIAVANQIGYLIIFFPIEIAVALERNGNRTRNQFVSKDLIEKMHLKLAIPSDTEGLVININTILNQQLVIECPALDKIISTQMINYLQPATVASSSEQNVDLPDVNEVHRIDILLRKEINRIIKNSDSVTRATKANVLCQKRFYLLKELRCGNLLILDFDDVKLVL